MVRQQTNLFVKLAQHRLRRALALIDAALRKLPCVFPYALAPKDLVFLINEDNPNIWTVAFAIKHGHSLRIQYNAGDYTYLLGNMP